MKLVLPNVEGELSLVSVPSYKSFAKYSIIGFLVLRGTPKVGFPLADFDWKGT
jgi:hypothetical protein